jgi:crotonobetainyl-CoA:carnitine CoA-transferase CaiB-like acyl-CoA transferase
MLPPWPEGKPGLNRSGYFNQYNQGKRSLTLNYAKPGALDVARRLVEASDVVTNNFAAGVMEKMGLGYEDLRKLKPDLIMISLSGYGDTGPYREYVAYGSLVTRVGRRCIPASATPIPTPVCMAPSRFWPRSTIARRPAKASTST